MIMEPSIFRRLLYLWVAGVLMGSWGCAARNSQRSLSQISETKKIMERQKAEIASRESTSKNTPEMTAEGYEALGDRYLKLGNVEMAFIQYDKALRLNPGRAQIRYKMGALFLEKGLAEEAQKEFQEILKTNPNHALAHEGMGRAYFQARRFPAAEESFRQAIGLDTGLWQAHNFLGIIGDRQGRFEDAIAQYRAAIALNPNEGALLNNLGASLSLSGKYEEAVKAFAEALKIETSNSKIYNNLALALCKLGRHLEALEVFKKGGDEASAYYNLGCIYMMEGKSKKAIQAFEKALEIKPGFYESAYENLKKAEAYQDDSGTHPPDKRSVPLPNSPRKDLSGVPGPETGPHFSR